MTVADRCPGVLRPHPAEDGQLIRLRIPGGQTTGQVLGAVARLAARHGHREVQLTSRSGLQVRGLPDPVPDAVVDELRAWGLLPSERHDRVRNIIASPLTGISGGVADLRPAIAALDHGLVADAALAQLPGRFLFALDDGTGDVSELPFDLGYRAQSAEQGELLLGSPRHRVPVVAAQLVPTLIHLAHAFLAARSVVEGRVWHVRDLPGWADAHALRVIDHVPAAPLEPRLGTVAGAASVQVPLGLLTQAQAAAVAAVAGAGPLVITPWRGLVMPTAAPELPALLDTGLVADPDSGWALVSACIGSPFCARTTLDTRAAATDLVRAGVQDRVHVSGCERRCGAPTVRHQELVSR